VLVPVFAGLPGGDRLFALCSLVVLVSVVLHGGSVALLKRSPAPGGTEARREREEPSEGERLPERMSLEQVLARKERGEPVVMLDARSHRSFEASGVTDPGSVRLDPDQPAKEAERLALPREAWLVAYCA
jgi:hypothetical protein